MFAIRDEFGRAGAAWLVLLLFAGLPGIGRQTARAQVSTAAVNGTVRDASHSVIAGATVILRNTATGVERRTQSNQVGNYVFVNIPPGPYTLGAEKDGFQRVSVEQFILEVNQTATFDLTLQVGQVQQSLTVQAVATELQASSAELGAVVEKQQVADLPLNGRNFSQLLRLVPGASPISVAQNAAGGFGNSPVGSITYPSFNGQSNRSNFFLTDGINNSETFLSGYAVPPIIDAIQEFKVQSHNDQAEFGMATGGVVNVVTRSGTNEFHGAAWEFLRNDALDARNFFRPSVTPLRQNMFGGTLGGPVFRNRTFFFVGYQGFRQSTPANLLYRVPTEANLRGDFSDWPQQIYDPWATREDPNRPGALIRAPFSGNQIPASRFDRGFLAYVRATVPEPIQTGVADRNQLDLTPRRQSQEEYTARVDHNFRQNDFFWARFSAQRFSQVGSGGRQGMVSILEYRPLNVGASWVHTFGAAGVLQVQFGRSVNDRENAAAFASGSANLLKETGFDQDFCCGFRGGGAGLVPSLIVAQFFSGGEARGFQRQSDNYQYKANYSWVRGNHQLRWGGEFNHMKYNIVLNDASVTFDSVGTADPQDAGRTGSPLASFLLNVPLSADRRDFFKTTRFGGILGFYVQDSWKLTQRLTVNLGIRYDRTMIPPIGGRKHRTIYMGDMDLLRGVYVLQAQPEPCAVAGTAPCIPDPNGKLPEHVIVDPREKLLHDWTDNWQPRIGLAYRLRAKTVIRSSFGVFFDSWAGIMQTSQNLGHTWPDVGRRLSGNLNIPTISGLLPTVSGKDPFPQALRPNPTPFEDGAFFVDPFFKNAYSLQWNLGVQHQLTPDTLLGLDYVGSGNRRLSLGGFYNVATTPGPGDPRLRRPFPYLMSTNFDRSWGRANYHALQFQLRKRFSRGLSYNVAYTWSKSISVGCDGFFGVEGCAVQDPYHFNRERSVSSTDLPHILNVNWLWELPIGKGRFLHTGNRAADYVIGSWQLNGIATIHSGQPFTVNMAGDIANTGNQSGYMRPNLLRDPKLSGRTVDRWFDTGAFAAPAPFTFGNTGRNILRGPGTVNFDLSVFRNFPLPYREGMDLEFRAEAFNAFNTTHFALPVSNLSNVNFSRVLNAGGERQLQLGIKLNF
ncbi:MAG: TonB-dependent receptor [Acidobacteria bacterium]|nr:TonB-dependent receptor [Acidobacteriota bacterium]